MSEAIMETLTPLLTNLVTIIISIIGIVVVGLLNNFKAWIAAKLGTETYNRAREVAIGLYNLLEDEFQGMLNAGAEKRAKMNELLLAQFPTLTQTELDAINKEVCAAIKAELKTTKLLEEFEETSDQPEEVVG